jgi:hypothetical protein
LETKELAVASQHCTVSHFLFTREVRNKKQHDYGPPSTLHFSVSSIELKGCHFDTVEAKLKALLNTLTEHDFQDAFEKCRSTMNGAHGDYRDYVEGGGGGGQ